MASFIGSEQVPPFPVAIVSCSALLGEHVQPSHCKGSPADQHVSPGVGAQHVYAHCVDAANVMIGTGELWLRAIDMLSPLKQPHTH